MARITVEDCLRAENNRFALVQLAAKRTKQLLHGSKIVIDDPRGNKAVVMSLREIASGKVRFMTEEELRIVEAKEAEEAKLLAEREAAAVSSDISIADLLFAQATSLKDEAALAADDDDASDDLDGEDGEIDDSDDEALDASDEIEDDSDEDDSDEENKVEDAKDEDGKPEPSDDF